MSIDFERRRVPRRLAGLAVLALVATACATPGAAAPTAAPSEAAPSGSEAAPSESAAATGPDCGTDPVTLNAYFETGFDLPFKLS